MGEFSIGQSPTRLEDGRLLTGQGRYLADINADRQLWAVILRSPHAHAEILSIDTAAAAKAPGVHTVLTGADYRADGLGVVPCMGAYKQRDGSHMYVPDRPALAVDRVMHIGYPVALVVADTE
ncbi:MAG: carbon monoxide dehydrogenase, partial [Alphaproteobacteria bacterium]|nr:carbon monoxide dehydrogenase [Alphaproteobacteria bacterium]